MAASVHHEFETFITREIEEPGQEAIEQLLAKRKMKPVHWQRIAKFVAAQQMRTPLFFIEFVRRMNEQIPEALEAAFRDLEDSGATEFAGEPSGGGNYLEDKLRVAIVCCTIGWCRRNSAPRARWQVAGGGRLVAQLSGGAGMARTCASVLSLRNSSVSVGPGATAFTVMPTAD
jgi:hypothetical protein